MLTNNHRRRSSCLAFLVSGLGMGVGTVAGFLAGIQPLLLGLALGAGTVGVLVYSFASFEQIVLGLLVVRSLLDSFSAMQLPALFALGMIALALGYVVVMLLTGRTIITDGFWWFLAVWVAFQGLWVVLIALGGLGIGSWALSDSIREWIRLFSWVMVYLLVMQLKGRIPPQQVVYILFWCLGI
ncbi:MAG: hypothetical protein F6K41_36270 [Symploca sp. SIO3E6]|nr:hypothetical protein [Caldora sp. SIO3E6]